MNEWDEESKQLKNTMKMLTSIPTRLEESDRKILKEILAELQKTNNTLEQILSYIKKNR